MPVSEILEIPLLTETMAQKTIAVNMALNAMEKAIAGNLSFASPAAFLGSVDIPFDTTNDFSEREALRAIYYTVTPGSTSTFTVNHPANPHLFMIRNQAAHSFTLRVKDVVGATLNCPSGVFYLVYCDGTNIYKMDFTLDFIEQVHDMHIGFYGKPAPNQVMGHFLIGRATTFPANLAGTVAKCGVNPLIDHSLGLFRDGVQFATITIQPTGNLSCTTTGGVAQVVSAGSIFEVRNLGVEDLLLDMIDITILARITVSQPVPV